MVLNKMENEHCAKDGNGVVQGGVNELNENTKMVHSFFLQQNVVFSLLWLYVWLDTATSCLFASGLFLSFNKVLSCSFFPMDILVPVLYFVDLVTILKYNKLEQRAKAFKTQTS